jgi:peptidyl-prolyl cis-trans isomerase SurA
MPSTDLPRPDVRRLPRLPPARRAAAGVAGLVALALFLVGGLGVPPALAQGLFAPRVHVNDQVITEYEILQRQALLTALGMPDDRREAMDRLIDERLMREAAARQGVRVSRVELDEGMAEFAGRYDVQTPEFLTRMRAVGVEAGSIREFVETGLMWRQVARREVGGRVVITEADVDRAFETAATRSTARVRLAEIVLPNDPRFAAAVADLTPRILAITTADEFSFAASQISVSPSRAEGGLIADWLPMTNFPPPLAQSFTEARIGQVVGPIELPGGQAIVFLQLRARDTVRNIPAGQTQLRYARIPIAGGRSEAAQAEAARIAADADSCATLPGISSRGPAGEVEYVEQMQTQLPPAVAIELARLNPGGVSTAIVEGDTLVMLMLCSRVLRVQEMPTRDQMRERLFSERANALTEGLLARLRADARIIYR